MLQRNWLLGKRIADEELQGENRAEYGKEVIKRLSDYLQKEIFRLQQENDTPEE